MQFTTPTAIQYKAISIAIEGKDIIGVAQSGTGKTLAFAIPVIQRLAKKRPQRSGFSAKFLRSITDLCCVFPARREERERSRGL